MSKIWQPSPAESLIKKRAEQRAKDYNEKMSGIGEEVIKIFLDKQLTLWDSKQVMNYVIQKIDQDVGKLNLNYLNNQHAEKNGEEIKTVSP